MSELIDIIVPEDNQEGTSAVLRTWLKQPGDAILKDEPVAELETDKVSVEVAAPADGILNELLCNLDEEVPPGTVIAKLAMGASASPNETAGVEEASTLSPADRAVSAANPHQPMQQTNGQLETRFSPAVRRLLREHNLDASAIKGTGRHGRITKYDVLSFKASPAARTKPGVPPGKANMPVSDVISVPHTSMRRQIASHMQNSVTVAPHVTAVFEADLNAIVADRRKKKSEFADRGVKLTYTAYFVRACVEAIRAVPEVNSRYFEDRLDIYQSINIGIGVALGDKGLVVPVIHNAQDLNLFGIAARLDDVTKRALDNSLTPKDVQGGTFSISNHGVSGSLLATPIIINQPQSAILGLGKMEKRVVVEETDHGDAMVIKNMAFVTLSIDHRVLDGFQTNKFLSVFTEKISKWSGE